MTRTRGVLLALAPLMLGVVGLPVADAATAPTTCRGLPVTMVVPPDTTVHATQGDDVIVVLRGYHGIIDAEDGNDVICIEDGLTTVPAALSLVWILAGRGDDVVENHSDSGVSYLDMNGGEGTDLIIGGPEDETATDGGSAPDEVDVFDMGAGDDEVVSGIGELPNPDRISLGEGDDTVSYGGSRMAAGGMIDGGPGTDLYSASAHRPPFTDEPRAVFPAGRLVVDAVTGTATVGGQPYARWSGIERYSFSEGVSDGLVFHGSPGDDVVRASYGPVLRIDLGPGDDVLKLTVAKLDGPLRGGVGRDRLQVRDDAVDLDLRGLLVVGQLYSPDRSSARVSGFEDAATRATTVRLTGTEQANRLQARGKRVRVFARAGKDQVSVSQRWEGDTSHGWVRGGAGRDRLRGTPGDDVLLGGRGRDVAVGRQGTDRCVAEVRRSCER